MFLIYLKSPIKIYFQSSLNNGGGGIVTLTPPNDAIVYQCSNSEEVGIQKVYNEKIIIANYVENTQLSLFRLIKITNKIPIPSFTSLIDNSFLSLFQFCNDAGLIAFRTNEDLEKFLGLYNGCETSHFLLKKI